MSGARYSLASGGRGLDPARVAPPSKEFIYGVNPAFEVLRAARRTVYQAYLNELTVGSPRLRKLVEFLERKGVPVELTDKGRLHQLCGSGEHQGVVLRTSLYPYVDHADMFTRNRVLLLDNVEDPHNVGAILRSAEIFGFHEVLLPTRGVPEIYPSVVKVSAGATEFMRIARDCTAVRYAQKAEQAGYSIVSLDAAGKTELRALAAQPPEKLLLVIGGEDRGVGQFIINASQHILRIDQHGRVNSLNASVAAGITMFALQEAAGPSTARESLDPDALAPESA